MDLQNLFYALIQIAHNFGAVAVVGGSVLARWPLRLEEGQRRSFAWVMLTGWAVQGMSGAAFGAVSYAYYGQFPDIHGIAIIALVIKMICAATGFVLTSGYLRFGSDWPARKSDLVWSMLMVLAVTALSSAAFLRWFS